jgi:MoaA/NifB/PqqE/SkfB family radical SAM enzyme
MKKNKIISIPPFVDFMLLGQCNMCCPFCFGPKHNIPPIKTSDAIIIIDRLKILGVKGIVFTGGEPSLMADLHKIISYAKKLGFVCVLSTNGSLYHNNFALFKKCADNLDWISFPIDSVDKDISSILRKNIKPSSIDHFEAIIDTIKLTRKKLPKLKIKIGTVATKINLNDIHKIPSYLLSKKSLPDTWKIYQVSPSEYGKINYNKLRISDTKFENIFKKCLVEAKLAGMKNVQKYSNTDRPGKYLFINPLGELLVINNKTNNYQSIGNILKNSLHNFSNINHLIEVQKNINNFNKTYPV